MKNLIYNILSRFPNKEGQKSLKKLLDQLSHGGINFKITSHKDESGSYLMAKAEVAGKYIITSGRSFSELDKNIKDAIFTAYKVSRYYCDEKLINSPLINQETELVYATR